MGWFVKFRKFVRKAAPIVAAVVAIVFPEVLPMIGEAMGASGASASVVGASTLSGGTTALAGGSPEDIAKAAAIAGGTTYLGQQFSAKPGADGTVPTAGKTISEGVQKLGGSPELGASVAQGTGTFVGQTAGGLAYGLSPEDALKQGAISGLVSGAGEYAAQKYPALQETSLGRLGRAAGETALGYGLASQFQQDRPAGTTYDVSMTGMPSGGAGSQALSQALRLGDPGAPLFGTEKEGQRRNVWNVASLKVKDETGA
jgi:hypothetical protein